MDNIYIVQSEGLAVYHQSMVEIMHHIEPHSLHDVLSGFDVSRISPILQAVKEAPNHIIL